MLNKDMLEIMGDILDEIRRDAEDWNELVNSINDTFNKNNKELPF